MKTFAIVFYEHKNGRLMSNESKSVKSGSTVWFL